MDPEIETTQVLICGAGPTGAVLSALLGQASIDNICLDKEEDITTDPRGIALDEDGIRVVQSVGVYDSIFTEIGQTMGIFNFVGGTRQDLSAPPFMQFDYSTSEGGTGHVGFICHKQPALEYNIRRALKATSHSQLRTSCTLTSIWEDNDFAYAEYVDKDGQRRRVRSKFFVGADGKTGYTRKHYMEPQGISMDRSSLTAYEETWVAVNWKLTLPTPETHPDFPLWKLGYTPLQVYDLFFPKQFRFLCNPQRPAVCGRFGLDDDRLWRFEYVIHKDEDGKKMSEPEQLRGIIYPYITHPGKRYGLREDVRYPEDCIKTLRARPFWFSARSCNKWALKRVILCGDAAHVFPPFGGQGIASGFRDASALAWRLELACRRESADYNLLLRGWYKERKNQLERSLAATVENGRYCTESDTIKVLVRNTYLSLVQLYPPWKRDLEKGQRREGMVQYKYEPDMAFLPEFGGGICLPQVYCIPIDLAVKNGAPDELVMFSDDVMFPSHKKGLFQLLILVPSAQDLLSALAMGDVFDKCQSLINPAEATCIIEDTAANISTTTLNQLSTTTRDQELPGVTIARTATAAEFAASPLCADRPEPKYYDPLRIGKEVGSKKYIVVRRDRFVFAACSDLVELRAVVGKMASALGL